MTLVADAAKSIVVTGNAGLDLTGSTYAKVTNFDASGVTGAATDAAALKVTYVSGNTTVAETVTIKGGSGNDSLTGSATANDTISGGDGVDTLVYNGGTDVFTGGAGKDIFTVSAAGTKISYLTIADAVAGDTINLAALGTVADKTAAQMLTAKVTLGAAATFDQYLDSAAAGIANTLGWFTFGTDTYLVVDQSAGGAFVSGSDAVIKLTGTVSLGTSTITTEVLTIV